jgi:hypothetical protein
MSASAEDQPVLRPVSQRIPRTGHVKLRATPR